MTDRICGHCCEQMRGHASSGDTWLCHPDDGPDCYTLVTRDKHALRCTDCDPTLRLGHTWAEVKARMKAANPNLSLRHDCPCCGMNLSIPANTIDGQCWAGNCDTFLCRGCRVEWGSAGPILCPCQGRHPTLRRIRKLYRRKSRGGR